jgi:hypothetical protein
MGKKLGIIFKGFWCGIMNIHNNKFVHVPKKLGKNIYFDLHKDIKI